MKRTACAIALTLLFLLCASGPARAARTDPVQTKQRMETAKHIRDTAAADTLSHLIGPTDRPPTGLNGQEDVAYYRSLASPGEEEDLYTFTGVDCWSKEIALELVMGILCQEDPELVPILVPHTGESGWLAEQYGYYEYIIRQQWGTDWQLDTWKVWCVEETEDYYLVGVTEFIIDGLMWMDNHQPYTHHYAVMKEDGMILEATLDSPLFGIYF